MHTVKYTYIALCCGVPGCQFGPYGPNPAGIITEVHEPEKLTDDDLQLLIDLPDIPLELTTPAQVERLNTILNGHLECPTHGREQLAYRSNLLEETSFRITIILDVDSDEPPFVSVDEIPTDEAPAD